MATADAPGIDMLTGLPEGVLHRIMSFLTLRQAVQTCVLSRRWRNLWRSMPLINADYKQFEVTESEVGDCEALALFKRFVNRVLELRDPVASLDKLCLWYSISDDNDDDTDSQDAVANRWISHALQKKARVVELYVDLVFADLYPLVIDHSVFTSSYLTKILFSNVILGDGFFKQLETGCPTLEDLSFHNCVISDGEISSQTLKVLAIKDTNFSMEHKTSISTPSVTSLTLWSPMDGVVILKDMASVVTASVKPSVFSDEFDVRGLCQYLWALSGVKNLEFYYLGEKNSPRLEKLTLKLNLFRYWQTSQRMIGEHTERSFTCGHLKFVEVICSENDPLANHVVDFFVSSGKMKRDTLIQARREGENPTSREDGAGDDSGGGDAVGQHGPRLDQAGADPEPAVGTAPRPRRRPMRRASLAARAGQIGGVAALTEAALVTLPFQSSDNGGLRLRVARRSPNHLSSFARHLFDESPLCGSATMEGTPGKRVRYTASRRVGSMLSDLPEGVLHHIMSFLDSRQAVQMCVLSQRWRNLWRSVPGINIDCKEFEVPEDKVVFIEFVNRLLELCDPVAPISKFSLWYSMTGFGCDTVKGDTGRWISHALQKQAWAVEVYVDLFYNYLKHLVIDHSVFTSSYLQRIWFSNVILDDGFFKQLEAGCPALEDLFLDECFIKDVEISSQTLKVLTIKRADFSTDPKTSISTPSVTSLTLSDPTCGIFVLKDMASVVTASVKPTFMPHNECITGLHQYLWTLSGVKNLEFFYPLTIENNLQWCPKFNNLVNLTLGEWCLHANFYALIVFIENSPRLEKLALKLYEFGQRTSKRTIVELNDRSFTCGHLKSVEVICFKDDPLANHVVDFLFSCGMTSAQIHIKHCW
uniref:F-box domain-containing protein n=1 Tax=Oryza punctata TaxID=4537 RepID=A0A0E0M564_ORYPU